MGLTLTPAETFRTAIGTHVRYRDATLAELVHNAGPEEAAMVHGQFHVHPPSGSRTEPNVRVTVTLAMPLWVRYGRASDADRAEWDRFYAALLEHEAGHYDRFARGARVMYDAVAAAPPADMLAEADRQWALILADQELYDETTAHGTTQQTSHGTTRITAGPLPAPA